MISRGRYREAAQRYDSKEVSEKTSLTEDRAKYASHPLRTVLQDA
jgi:plasmid replication initiation protein